ncbi:MAG TPA: thermonuclease family protein [Actinomycetota bacterium]|nr:thermonuclease family protein [Actinomycetota bacterium]
MRREGQIRVVLAAIVTAALAPQAAAVPSDAFRSRVTHVSDGDTAYMTNLDYGTTATSWPGRKARFIGVDTPEVYGTPECYGKRASAFTKRKLEGNRVKVTYDIDRVDPYDRALVYIWVNGRLFNATLVRKGFARVLIYEPNDRYETRLRRLQSEAQDAKRGLWGAC